MYKDRSIMKVIIILFCVISLQVHSTEYKFVLGSPSETIIIAKENEYVIIHNPTKYSYDLMKVQASAICQQINNNQEVNARNLFVLGKYTAYFTCRNTANFINDLNQVKKINDNEVVLQSSDEKYFRSKDFIFKVRSQYFENIKNFESRAEEREMELSLLKKGGVSIYSLFKDRFVEAYKILDKQRRYEELKKIRSLVNENIIQSQVQTHFNTCNQYNFVEGSKYYKECILRLMRPKISGSLLVRDITQNK